MGYTKNGSITNFEPDDTESEFYILASYSDIYLESIIEKARDKWGDININNLYIRPENIHTRCIHYDLHDPSDYDNYLVIGLNIG